ncbi:MAG: purine-nucleoside phosphorylase [Firmicutes bacterium]|nr:purine-nucleoside phosphorylase [Bacillota bacterium]
MFYEKVTQSADFIKSKISHKPTIGIILGSGLGGLVDIIEDKEIIPYKDIPNFPQTAVEGHAGNFVFGKIGNNTVAAMQGRFHYYEGFTMKEVTYPVYVMKMLGIDTLIVTNACGGINKSFVPGDLMIIEDHINMLGANSLIGKNDDRFGPRFPDMSEVYSKELIAKAENIAKNIGIDNKKGVFAIFSGPCYETAAEIRAYAVLGADAIGMSTVPEAIAANYLSMKVLGISCITNMATGISKTKHSHEEVVRMANISSQNLCLWIKELILNW